MFASDDITLGSKGRSGWERGFLFPGPAPRKPLFTLTSPRVPPPLTLSGDVTRIPRPSPER